MRSYLPRAEVRLDLLQSSPTRTACAYRGVASYPARGGADLARSYEAPLPDAGELAGLVLLRRARGRDGGRGEAPAPGHAVVGLSPAAVLGGEGLGTLGDQFLEILVS